MWQNIKAWRPFLLMFGIVFFLNLNFTILRALRNTLVVVDIGHGAQSIPYYEMFGAMPAAFILTWILTRLLKRFPIIIVFFMTIAVFMAFFLFFALYLYPMFQLWKEHGTSHLLVFFEQIVSIIFYIMSELWKSILILIFFWGLVNQYVARDEGKILYGPLMFAASLGAMIAGPLITKSSAFFSSNWQNTLIFIMLFLFGTSCIAAFLYYHLWRGFTKKASLTPSKHAELSDNLKLCWKNPYLRILSFIVIVDYIAYSLGEVIFLDILKQKFPTPNQYFAYMGSLSFWGGLLTILSSTFITPYILRKCRWATAAVITPICLLMTGGAFFVCIGARSILGPFWLGLAIFLGSIQFCLCRSVKYTLFDASKELVYLSIPNEDRLNGKLVVDGIGTRFGRVGASILSVSLLKISGSLLASSWLAGLLSIAMSCSWLMSSIRLGRLIDKIQHSRASIAE